MFLACLTGLSCPGAPLNKSCRAEAPAVDGLHALELLNSIPLLLGQVKPFQIFTVILTNESPGAPLFFSENQDFCVGG